MNSSLEVDFLAVGNGEKSGDAIALRYGNFADVNQQYVVVIDGGTIDSGKELVELIKNTYQTTYVDLVISTHPDGDHSSGLREVLNELTVGELWLHRPWEHSSTIKGMFKDGRITDNSLSERIKDAYNFAFELEKIAIEKKIKIVEPFEGVSFDNGTITVLGPSKSYYLSLVPDFNKTPEAKLSTFSKAVAGVSEAIKWVFESMTIETLDENGETSAENNSCAIVLLKFGTAYYLFTGDAGIPSLNRVLTYAKTHSIDLSNIHCMQIPHHGSKRNISPSIIDQIMPKHAIVSASESSPKHPAKKVTNAFKRRNVKTYATKGRHVRIPHNAPSRTGYSSMEELPFYEKVEE